MLDENNITLVSLEKLEQTKIENAFNNLIIIISEKTKIPLNNCKNIMNTYEIKQSMIIIN